MVSLLTAAYALRILLMSGRGDPNPVQPTGTECRQTKRTRTMAKATDNVARRVCAMSELLGVIAPAIKKAVESGATLDDIKNLLNDLIAIVESEEE
jgi:hypothetical protein